MSAWDNLKGSLFAAGRDVSQKAKEVSEVAKLKMDIHTKEDFVEKQFAALGHAYYEANKDHVSEADEAQFTVIKEALEEIERMSQQVLDIQGVVRCPNCGKKVPSDNSFCSDCGTKLEEIIVEATVVSEEPITEDVVTEENTAETTGNVKEAVVEEAVVEEPVEVVAEETEQLPENFI